MTVQSELSRADYSGDGVTVDFTVPFRFLDKTHLRVIRSVIATGAETELTLDSLGADGFSVVGAGLAGGGEVTVVTAPVGAGATQERITVLRNVPATQLLDYISNDAFPAESHERGLDQLTMLHGQQGEVLARAMVLPESVNGVSANLPIPVALRPLVWNAAANALENGDTTLTGDMLLRGHIFDAGYRYGDDVAPTGQYFFIDDEPQTRVHRFRDRVLFGDATPYTARRTAPYGGDWLTENGASYFIKNSQVAVLGDETEGRYAFLAAARGGGIGGAFVILNENGAAGRAIYAEAMHKGTATASTAMEMAVSNYTATDFNPSAYSMGGARGLYIAAFEGAGYVVGDAGTAVTQATLPPAAAIDIAGYSTTATRFRKGIVFRNGGLYRGTGDGSTGEAVAISMAQKHAFVWDVSDGVRGAVVRSDVTTAGANVGVLFGNNVVQLIGADSAGTGEFPIVEFVRDAAGAGAVNNAKFTSARTGINPKYSAQGGDTNVGLEDQTKGNGSRRFLGQGGSSESLRILFTAGSYVNYGTVVGAIAGASPTWGVAGSDANIDWIAGPKGTGLFGLSYAATNAATPASFSATRTIAMKFNGVTLYVPAMTTTW